MKKPELQSVIIFISAMALFYFAFSFYWLTFDFARWNEVGRALYLFIGGSISAFASIFNLIRHYNQ